MSSARSQDTWSTQKKTIAFYRLTMNMQKLKLKTIPFTIAQRKWNTNKTSIKYVHWKFQKDDKKIKENLYKWRGLPCSWIGRFNIVKRPFLPKMIYRFNVISIKISDGFLQTAKLILKFICEDTGHRIDLTNSLILKWRIKWEVTPYPILKHIT